MSEEKEIKSKRTAGSLDSIVRKLSPDPTTAGIENRPYALITRGRSTAYDTKAFWLRIWKLRFGRCVGPTQPKVFRRFREGLHLQVGQAFVSLSFSNDKSTCEGQNEMKKMISSGNGATNDGGLPSLRATTGSRKKCSYCGGRRTVTTRNLRRSNCPACRGVGTVMTVSENVRDERPSPAGAGSAAGGPSK